MCHRRKRKTSFVYEKFFKMKIRERQLGSVGRRPGHVVTERRQKPLNLVSSRDRENPKLLRNR